MTIYRSTSILLALLCILPACTHIQGTSSPNPTRPNIVIILADDMGYGDLNCQNPDSKIPTPHLDRLASQGMRFTDAHSPSAVCTPTRYALLTGTYAWRSNLKSGVLWPWDPPLIEEDTLTLPAMLRDVGYDTACIGKWHLGWDWATTDGSSIADVIKSGTFDKYLRGEWSKKIDFTKPIEGGRIDRGFDYYYGDDVPNFPPYTFIENEHVVIQPSADKPKEMFGLPGPMAPDWDLRDVMPTIAHKSAEYIRQHSEKPYFLYVPFTAPHTPIAPTPEFIGKSDAYRYGDFVNEVDWAVGQIVQAIEDSGEADNTLVIFTSDNGSPRRDGSNMNGAVSSVLKYGHNPSHIYRGTKADIWEAGHRVPFIAKWPGQINNNTVSNEMISLVDIMATCAAITGVQLPKDSALDSYSLVGPLKQFGYMPPLRKDLINHSSNGMFAIRQGEWKFIDGRGSGGWSKDGRDAKAPGQLYNLSTDPQETQNLYDTHPEKAQSMHTLLRHYQKSGRSVAAQP